MANQNRHNQEHTEGLVPLVNKREAARGVHDIQEMAKYSRRQSAESAAPVTPDKPPDVSGEEIKISGAPEVPIAATPAGEILKEPLPREVPANDAETGAGPAVPDLSREAIVDSGRHPGEPGSDDMAVLHLMREANINPDPVFGLRDANGIDHMFDDGQSGPVSP